MGSWPGWTDYHVRIQYQTYHVTALLRPGDNVVGAILGDGWYCGHVGWHTSRYYGVQPRLLLQLEIEHDDGQVETVVTDHAWQERAGPILVADLQMGEVYDARAEMPGWSEPGGTTSGWCPVVTEERIGVALVADRAEPIQVTEEIEPRAIMPLDAGTTIVDMGQNMVGWVRRSATALGRRPWLRG
jgi:alpha-L-rhamnosidase